MKNFVTALSFFALLFFANSADAQTAADWKEKQDFHKVMSQTFHPVQSGDFKPIRKRSGEMYEMASAWQVSAIPADIPNSQEIAKKLKNLVKAAKQLDSRIKSGCTNDFIFEKLTGLHDIFHDIVGLCSDEEHH